jgi:hypothetical protein
LSKTITVLNRNLSQSPLISSTGETTVFSTELLNALKIVSFPREYEFHYRRYTLKRYMLSPHALVNHIVGRFPEGKSDSSIGRSAESTSERPSGTRPTSVNRQTTKTSKKSNFSFSQKLRFSSHDSPQEGHIYLPIFTIPSPFFSMCCSRYNSPRFHILGRKVALFCERSRLWYTRSHSYTLQRSRGVSLCEKFNRVQFKVVIWKHYRYILLRKLKSF